MRLTGSLEEPELAFLSWSEPRPEWSDDLVVALPRGISRHIVRFVRINGVVYAVKEVEVHFAEREYELLFDLVRRGLPTVEPVGIVLDRRDTEGEPLPAGLTDYVTTILAKKPDEQDVLGSRVGSPSEDTAELRIVLPPVGA